MVVVQYVLLLGSDSWVITPNVLRFLSSLHNWVVQRTTERMPRCQNGRWENPPIGEALSETDLEKIGKYISCCHTSVAQYITTRSISDLVVVEEKQPISPATMHWWEQEIIRFHN